MEETPNDFTLMEPVSPEALIPDHNLLPWIIAAVVLIAILLIAIVTIIVLVKKRPIKLTSIRATAFKEASETLDKINADTTRETAVDCSLALRTFLAKAARDPALYETHEEFIARQNSLAPLTNEAKEAAQVGFEKLAALKYSADDSSESTTSIIADSKTLLETLNRGFSS